MFIRASGGRKKSEKFVSTEGTISVTTNVSGASVKITTSGAISPVAELKMDDASNSATTAKLQPGEYIVEVSKKGYDTKTITVNVNGDQKIDVTLNESIKTGAAATVANSLVEYKNTVLVNDNAIVTVVVKDKDGHLVPGKTVVFSASNHEKLTDGTTAKYNKELEVKGQNVQTTDANGSASFVVGYKNPTKDSTESAKVTSADYTAKVLDVTDGTDSIVTGSVGFAALSIEGVDLKTAVSSLAPGENASKAGTPSNSGTYSLNENNSTNVAYVSAQKVSTEGTNEHEVTFSAKPYIILPGMASEDKKATEFIQPVNYKSGKYFTYANKKYDKTIVLEEEASSLEYATLMFNEIKLSKHTKLVIDSYDSVDTTSESNRIKEAHKEITGEHSQKDFGYQLPLNENVKAIKVSIKSAGQVQTDMNDGYDIKEIKGVYKNSNSIAGGAKLISSAEVKWENVNPTMSDYMKLDKDSSTFKALNIIPKADNDTFDYQVPVFPYTGDAVIREFDTNDKIVAYYLVPTIKSIDAKTKNTNIIKPNTHAYEATAEEATNHSVGTLTSDGINVKVNSSKVGSTNVKGTISLPSLGGDAVDDSNKNIYTSVQWNPLPKAAAAVAASEKFMALSGQNVTVYAQLIDKNGNPVTLKDYSIKYSYKDKKTGETKEFKSGESKETIDEIAVVKNANTDVNGRATLILNSAQANYIDNLKATSNDYDVVLYIGKGKTSNAGIYWINPDLGFSSNPDKEGYEFVTDNSTEEAYAKAPVVSTPWQFAVKAIGRGIGSFSSNTIDIEGLKIKTTFDEDNKGTYKIVDNGVVDSASASENADTVINEFSTGENIKFDIYKGDILVAAYDCVGEGSPNFNAKMKLHINWEAKGTKLSITSPAGTTISKAKDDKTKGTTDLYVKVTDETGNNPKANAKVTFKSGTETDTFTTFDTDGKIDGTTAVASASAITDSNGIAHVKLNLNDTTKTQKSSVITASVEGADDVATTTINWVNYDRDLGLVNAAIATDNDKQLVLTFNNSLEASSVKLGQFTLTAQENGKTVTYEITKATANGKYVYLDLKSALNANEYTVTYNDYTKDSITYKLSDEKGVSLKDDTTINFYSTKNASFDVDLKNNDNGTTSDLTIKNIKSPIASIDGNGITSEKVAFEYFKKYVKVVIDGVVCDTAIDNTNATTTASITCGTASYTLSVTGSAVNATANDLTFTIQGIKRDDKSPKTVSVFFLGSKENKTISKINEEEKKDNKA